MRRIWPGLPVHIFRLPGIYGPGRGPLQKIREGDAKRISKVGAVSELHLMIEQCMAITVLFESGCRMHR
jgi:nucleoside-diphosphate-sugar epimerase